MKHNIQTLRVNCTLDELELFEKELREIHDELLAESYSFGEYDPFLEDVKSGKRLMIREILAE